ncbi:hypothetical protein [Streptosporangium carneum]|uniref:Uncharacterized protein n=1 Tax=Streptosporangium carneum TaxID=47481 RepID=A0A9W6I403_9ACTN|nr:hypothetical protein [Streptosporangium carneum]GLK11257.1 hypothetical protein GCM10017600_46630 [Streptosporangium carneum]
MTRDRSVTSTEVGWETLLSGAFEALLGRPLASYDPDAVYAAYYHGNFFREARLDREPTWLNPVVLAGGEPIEVGDLYLYDMGEPPLRFDASRSIFHVSSDGLPDAFAADLEAACFAPDVVRGADLAPVLWRHGLDLTDSALARNWEVCYARIASTGTLLDAMRVATGIGRTPGSLIAFEGEAEEEWEQALAAVPHPGLRAHLRLGCCDPADAEGLTYLGSEVFLGSLLGDLGCSVVAGWEDGHGQVDVTVIQLDDVVVGPRPA